MYTIHSSFISLAMFFMSLSLFTLPMIAYAQSSKSAEGHAVNTSSSEDLGDSEVRVTQSQRRAVKRLIEEAIAHGVPLYNRGEADACRSIYHVALRAIQQLAPEVRDPDEINEALEAAIKDRPQRGAWRLRYLIDAVYSEVGQAELHVESQRSGRGEGENSASSEDQELKRWGVEFDQISSWYTLNDNVMGGVSRGGMSMEQSSPDSSIGVFSGALSLDNNGGFSSTRARIPSGALSTSEGLTLRVRGDGRRYEILVSTQSAPGSWQESFVAPETWTIIRIPFEKMRLSIRGRSPPVAPEVDPARITAVGFLIKDKLERPFRLEVDWVRGF